MTAGRAPSSYWARNTLHSVIKLGAAAEAVPVLQEWLADADANYSCIETFWLLRATGPAAAAVASALRRMLSSPDAKLAMQAADTLWAVEGNAGEILPVYERLLPALGGHDFCVSLRQLGPAAAPLAGHVRRMLDGPDDPGWVAAITLWTISGDVEAALPTLVQAWTDKRYA